jgi:uncharacterized membrane protein
MWMMLWLACGGGEGSDESTDSGAPLPDSCDVRWDAWANGFFATYCRSCHSETSPHRYDAPEGVDMDDLDDVRTWSERIRIRVLDDETMPVGGGVPQSELTRLDEWLDCLGGSR